MAMAMAMAMLILVLLNPAVDEKEGFVVFFSLAPDEGRTLPHWFDAANQRPVTQPRNNAIPNSDASALWSGGICPALPHSVLR
jgi:hypothetical protein